MGLCTKCGKENPTPEKSMCPDCAARQSELRKQNREYRKKIGICTHCGKNPAEPNKKLCYECLGQFQDGYAAKGRTDEQREKDRLRKKQLKEERIGMVCALNAESINPSTEVCVNGVRHI